MKLSENFSLDEMLFSATAERQDIDNTPTDEISTELRRLAETVLQPLRDAVGEPIVVTSGYRSPKLNAAIGGSRTSDHMAGRAADIKAIGLSPLQLTTVVKQLDLPIKQCIHEFGRWVHVSIPDNGVEPRKEFLTAVRYEGSTRYVNGALSVDGATDVIRRA